MSDFFQDEYYAPNVFDDSEGPFMSNNSQTESEPSQSQIFSRTRIESNSSANNDSNFEYWVNQNLPTRENPLLTSWQKTNPNLRLKSTHRRYTHMIKFQKRDEIKQLLIQKINKMKLKQLKVGSKITFVLKNQITKDKKKNNNQGKGHHKNLPKILGNAIISYALNKQNHETIEDFLDRKNQFFRENYPNEIGRKFTYSEFIEWVKTADLKKNLVKLQTFREIWGYKCAELNSMPFPARFFCCVLKRISKQYMEKEFIANIFKKVSEGIIQSENAIRYLEKQSVFVRGLKDPKNLKNIEEKP